MLRVGGRSIGRFFYYDYYHLGRARSCAASPASSPLSDGSLPPAVAEDFEKIEAVDKAFEEAAELPPTDAEDLSVDLRSRIMSQEPAQIR